MLKINGKVWYEPLVNPCSINWDWYHYPTLEEALEGLKKRSPEDYEQEIRCRNAGSSWSICEMEEERYGVHHWAYRLHK